MQNIANIYNNSNKNYCKEKSKNLAILIGGNGGENCLLDERFKEHLCDLDASKSDFKKFGMDSGRLNATLQGVAKQTLESLVFKVIETIIDKG